MIRVGDDFKRSRPLYALDLSSYRAGDLGDENCGYIRAAWFRHRGGWKHPGDGIEVACIGEVRGFLGTPPLDMEDFLARHTDNRYGGHCHARWDGEDYWGAPGYGGTTLNAIARNTEFLVAMLDAYPAVPEGFDGWWGF
jgi:hypothetical protein